MDFESEISMAGRRSMIWAGVASPGKSGVTLASMVDEICSGKWCANTSSLTQEKRSYKVLQ